MRRCIQYFVSLLLALHFGHSYAEQEKTRYVDIVIDLDQVILYSARKKGETTVKADDKHWQVAVGASEFVESLLKIPNVRVSFFSARGDDRNIEAVKKITISDGRSFYDLAEDRVYSADDMKWENEMRVKDFADRVPGLDEKSAILVDDNVSPASKRHRKNLLWIYYRDRNRRLAIARGVIEAALEKSKKEKIDVVDALFALQYNQTDDGELRFRRIEDEESYLDKGERLFKNANPNFSFPRKENVRESDDSPTHKMRSEIKKARTEAVEDANKVIKEHAKKHRKRPKFLEKPVFPEDCRVIFKWINGKL